MGMDSFHPLWTHSIVTVDQLLPLGRRDCRWRALRLFSSGLHSNTKRMLENKLSDYSLSASDNLCLDRGSELLQMAIDETHGNQEVIIDRQ